MWNLPPVVCLVWKGSAMPILYVHGVNVRTEDSWRGVERRLRERIAPEISNRPGDVLIRQVFWGDAGLLLALTARGVPYTADGLGLAAGLAGDLLGLLSVQDARRSRVEAARHTLRRALAATRPGGLFAVWKAPANPLSPHDVPVFLPEERQP